MKTLYIECNMGVAGDMLSAALYELLSEEDKKAYLTKMNSLGLPGVIVQPENTVKCGITGTHMSVIIHGEEEMSKDADLTAAGDGHDDHEHHHDHDDHDEHDHHDHDHEHHHDDHHDHDHDDHDDHEHHHDHDDHEHHHHHHHHTSMAEITAILDGLDLPADVRTKAAAVYHTIAEAEGKVHGRPVEEIHFHEVGSLDAVADVVGVSLLMHMIAPERTIVSPIHVGSGEVHCAHGILPVPAPATMEILSKARIPFYSGRIRGELCTPTGAALIAAFADEYSDHAVLTVDKVGYGCGNKDFEAANVVRVMLGGSREVGSAACCDGGTGDFMRTRDESAKDSVHELVCNLDDMTAEEIGFATEELMNAGALDVYTTNIGMKKNRPGVMLTCMCRDVDKERMLTLMFRHTTTLGVREYECRRYKLTRREEITSDYKGEPVRRKVSEGYGTRTSKLEYEDAARIARKEGISLREARRLAEGGTCET